VGWCVAVLCQHMCQYGIQVSPAKDRGVKSQLLCPSVSRHPSICPALCHASQQDADGFTLDPALSPLSLRLSLLASCLHLSAICYILLASSHITSSTVWFHPSPSAYLLCHSCLGCLVQEFDWKNLQESKGKYNVQKRWPSLVNSVSPYASEMRTNYYFEGILSLIITHDRLRKRQILCGTLPTPGGSSQPLHHTNMIISCLIGRGLCPGMSSGWAVNEHPVENNMREERRIRRVGEEKAKQVGRRDRR